MYNKKQEQSKPVELVIYDIGEKYQQFNAFLTTLRVNFKFFNFDLLEIWESD